MADELEVVTQEVQPDAPPEETVAPEDEPDWKAKFEEAEARAAKVEQDLRSERGRRNSRDRQENILLDIGERLANVERSNSALVRSFTDGENDALAQELSQIQASSARSSAARGYQTAHAELSEELLELAKDDAGENILDVYTAPEMEEVRQQWVTAHNAQDVAGLRSALRQAEKVMRNIERTRSRDAVDAARTEERQAAKRQLQDAGVFDLDTGPAASGAGLGDDDFLTEYARNPERYSSAEDHARARKLLSSL